MHFIAPLFRVALVVVRALCFTAPPVTVPIQLSVGIVVMPVRRVVSTRIPNHRHVRFANMYERLELFFVPIQISDDFFLLVAALVKY